jgi:hypothetical protein
MCAATHLERAMDILHAHHRPVTSVLVLDPSGERPARYGRSRCLETSPSCRPRETVRPDLARFERRDKDSFGSPWFLISTACTLGTMTRKCSFTRSISSRWTVTTCASCRYRCAKPIWRGSLVIDPEQHRFPIDDERRGSRLEIGADGWTGPCRRHGVTRALSVYSKS